MKKSILATLCVAAVSCGAVHAAETEKTVRDNLMSATGLVAESVKPAPIAGLWEVVIQNRIFYVDPSVKYVVAGSILDTKTQNNLTQERLQQIARDSWKSWPFKDAIKQVYGKGTREVVVFADANCGYCRVMETTFEKVGDLTVYTFIFPMFDSKVASRNLVCAKNPGQAWHDWMVKRTPAPEAPANCDSSALERNAALAARYGITGTPTTFFPSGDRVNGAIPAEQLEMALAQK